MAHPKLIVSILLAMLLFGAVSHAARTQLGPAAVEDATQQQGDFEEGEEVQREEAADQEVEEQEDLDAGDNTDNSEREEGEEEQGEEADDDEQRHHHHHHHHHRHGRRHHRHHRHGHRHHGKHLTLKCWARRVHKASQMHGKALWHRKRYHSKLLKQMWRAVRRNRRQKNRTRYFKLLHMFRRLQGAWNRRKGLIHKALKHALAARQARLARREQLRKTSRLTRKNRKVLRAKYERSYMRYLKLISGFFRRKYRVLHAEYMRERNLNGHLKRTMWDLRAKLRVALEAKELMAKLRAKRAALAHWIKVAKDLQAKIAALTGQMGNLGRAHAALKKAHDDTTRNLTGANATIAALRKQIAQLEAQLNQSKSALHNCQLLLDKENAKDRAAAEAALKKYNILLAQYNAALAAHGALTRDLRARNDALRKRLDELLHMCIPDVCGVCGGNEATCARVRSEETCHAVGDPHYRTFSDFYFNYQVTGEFSLSRHLHDFEVQNHQEPCPNPAVRCNKAFAVRAGSHVVVVYAAWGPGTILVDGQKVRTTLEKRVDLDKDTSYTAHGNMVEVRFADALVKGYINPWADTQYMDLYVTAPARWSSGRSLTGLCGTWNGDRNSDSAAVSGGVNNGADRPTGAQFWVANTARSLFRNPNPRTESDLQFEDSIFLQENMAQNDVIAQAMREAGSVSGQPQQNLNLAFKDPQQKAEIEAACSKGVHGNDKLDCEFDMLAGESAKDDRRAFQVSQLLDHEKLLLVCQPIDAVPSATVNADHLAGDEHQEGFTYAFWYQPNFTPQDDQKESILARGNTFTVDVEGSAIVARHGSMTCTSTDVVENGKWIQVTVAVSHLGSITTYIGGTATCRDHEDDPPKTEFGDAPLEVVNSDGKIPPAKGFLARLFYLPLTIEKRDVTRYSDRKQPSCSADTPQGSDPADEAPSTDV